MAYNLGKVLGMTGEELSFMHIVGDLHDIGKIGVPDRVLNKAGKLEARRMGINEKAL